MEGSDGKGAITELLKIAAAQGRKARKAAEAAEGGDEGGEGEGAEDGAAAGGKAGRRGKRQSSAPKLSRPIICICNDLCANTPPPSRDVCVQSRSRQRSAP